MSYSTFNEAVFDAKKEPMFLGQNVNVARYDEQKYSSFERLIQRQLSFFWRPEEVDLTRDRKDYLAMPDHERHIFVSNLKYQTLLDSVQGRSPNVAFLPIVSLPELETWLETWAFSETIHSRSYTHIIRNIVTDPSLIFNDIVVNDHIKQRAKAVTEPYDALIEKSALYTVHSFSNHSIVDQANNALREVVVSPETIREDIYRALVSVYVLEAIRFYVSFACTFAFGERAIMEGNAKIVKLIARDEALHKFGTQLMINYIKDGKEGAEWKATAEKLEDEAKAIFMSAINQEKAWAEYLFKDGTMIGLNAEILGEFVEYTAANAAEMIGLDLGLEARENPLPWMQSWLVSTNVQVAPQETEISSYLVGQIDASVDDDDLDDIDL